jgi:hypothetical protein
MDLQTLNLNKTVQLLKLYFVQNSTVVQQYTSASECKFIGNIPQIHFMRTFSALRLIRNAGSSITRAPFLQC